MSVEIRDLDLRSDRDELIQFLYENLTQQMDRARFDWLYMQNPFGPGRAWKAVNEVTGSTVGVAAAFPRRIWCQGQPRRGWVLGDFCIAASSRTLGPAVFLQQACLRSIAVEDDSVWYDFPSRSMLAVYRRLGLQASADQTRYVKLFEIDSTVERHIPFNALARTISLVGNSILKLRAICRSYSSDLDMSLLDGIFGEEFTEFDSRIAGPVTVRGVRTADYLNWRYLQHPFNRYRVVVARQREELLGYGVLEVNGTEWTLMDLQALEESRTVPKILRYIEWLLRRSDAVRLTASIPEGAPLSSFLRRNGFYRREGTPIVTYGGATTANWYLMQGDRES